MQKSLSRAKRRVYDLVKGDALVLVAAALLFCALVVIKKQSGRLDWGELDPSAELVETIVIAVLGWSVIALKRFLLNLLEDDVKLTSDYESLVKLYAPSREDASSNKLVSFDNTGSSDLNRALLLKDHPLPLKGWGVLGTTEKTLFPVVLDFPLGMLNVDEIEIIDSQLLYELPAVVQAHFVKIIAAHQESHLYNQTVIRVKDWQCSGDRFLMMTERSTYFNSMVTNRAMDYDFGEVTIRKLFEYGPRISSLKESKLSNHLGFNAFVITSDGFIPFVKRGREMSIGKGTFGNSIGASIKAKYALDRETGSLDSSGLARAVIQEIEDELKLTEDDLDGKPVVVAAYRDLLEGGKPQLLIVARTKRTREDLGRKFKRAITNKKTDGISVDIDLLEDGKQLAWASVNDLRNAAIAPDALYVSGQRLPMVPSASASVAMLLQSKALERDRHGSLL